MATLPIRISPHKLFGYYIPLYLVLLFFAALLLFPFIWLMSRSIMPYKDIFAVPTIWFPKTITFVHFQNMFSLPQWPFGRYFMNTLLVTLGVIAGRVFSASLVAFGFSRIRFPGRDALFLLVLSTMMIPFQVVMIPTYILFNKLGWLNTLLPLIVPSFFGGGAFYIFLFRQFIMTIPAELDDAARIDGCSRLGIYWNVIFPLMGPATVTVVVFSFLETWNDFLHPLIFLTRAGTQTLALALQQFVQVQFMQAEMVFVVATVAMIPPLIIFFAGQRYFVEGMIMSGLKG